MRKKVIILPDREEMLERLLKVSDSSHLQEGFYPLLLESAGEERNVHGIVMMISSAIHEYAKDMIPVMTGIIYLHAPRFIDALVSDTDMAKEANLILEKILSVNE